MAADGSITLTTKVDQTGLNKGISTMKSGVKSLTSSVLALGSAIGVAFGFVGLVNFGKAATKLASDLQEVQNVVDTAFGDMSYKIEEFSKAAIDNFGLSELTAKSWASTMLAMGRGMGQSLSYGSDMAVELTGRLADVMSFYNKTAEEAQTLGQAIYSGETEPLKRIGIVMTEANLQLFAMQRGYKQLYKDMNAADKLMVRQEYFLKATNLAAGDFVKTQDGWANSTRVLTERWKQMQTEFGKAFMILGSLVLPVLNPIINGLTAIAQLAQVAAANIAAIFGTKLTTTEKSLAVIADNSKDASKGLLGIGKSAEKSGKDIQKSMASFDEIYQITSQISESAGGASGEDLGIDLSGFNVAAGEGTFDPMEQAEKVNAALAFIMGVVGISLIAVGLLLLFSGNIPWGIGFIIAGAAIFGISAASLMKFDDKNVSNALSALMGVAGGALIAIGIILIMLGSVPWGIGFIIAGAAILGVQIANIVMFSENKIINTLMLIQGAAAGALLALGIMLLVFNGANPLSIGLIIAGATLLAITVAQLIAGQAEKETADMIYKITAIASGALLALGIILVMVGIINPLSIGLIVSGAVGLASTAALNWNATKEMLSKFFKDNAELIAGVSLALLVLGVVLLLTGVGIPIAIGLILIGVTGLASAAALNWNYVKNSFVKFFKDNTGLIVGVSLSLLVLGIILLFTGVGIPIAIGLILAGVAGLATIAAVNWNFMLDKIKEVWGNIKNFWNSNIAKYFTAAWWAELGKNAMNGLIGAFESGINWIIDKINGLINGINSVSSKIPGGSFLEIPNIPKVSIPRLATGAVVPPNREFLAVLGDNKTEKEIVSPLSTIEQAVENVLARSEGSRQYGTVVLEINGREFGRAVVEFGNEERDRLGVSLLPV